MTVLYIVQDAIAVRTCTCEAADQIEEEQTN